MAMPYREDYSRSARSYFLDFLRAKAFLFASALDDAPHAFKDNNNLVGLPFLYSGPGMLPMRARNEDLRGLLPDLTGGFRSDPGLAAS
jgi:hypothetical protein